MGIDLNCCTTTDSANKKQLKDLLMYEKPEIDFIPIMPVELHRKCFEKHYGI